MCSHDVALLLIDRSLWTSQFNVSFDDGDRIASLVLMPYLAAVVTAVVVAQVGLDRPADVSHLAMGAGAGLHG